MSDENGYPKPVQIKAQEAVDLPFVHGFPVYFWEDENGELKFWPEPAYEALKLWAELASRPI